MKHTKRILSVLLTLCLLLALFPASALAANSQLPFIDVEEDAWYTGAVQYVYERGIMNGTEETSFSPNTSTTRGMIATILHRLEYTPDVTGTNPFADVEATSWYTEAIIWAAESGLVEGYGDGTFGPHDPITREQMVTLLYRYARYKEFDTEITGDISVFSDADQVSAYAVDAMNWAVGLELIVGMENNALLPYGNATRAQIATLLMRFGKRFLNPAVTLSADEVYFVAGEEASEITFTADLEGLAATCNLTTEEGDLIGKMHDDGMDGDVTANDGTYTYVFAAEVVQTTSAAFCAQADEATSDPVSIYFFAQPTEAEAAAAQEELQTVNQTLLTIEASYEDETGSIPAASEAAMIAEMETHLETLLENGTVLLYESEGSSIYIKFTSGLTLVYEPYMAEVSSGGQDVALTFVTYQPNPDIADPVVISNMEQLADALDNCSYSDTISCEGEAVTLDVVKSFGSNQVVFWNGHGGYGPIVKSFLATGEAFDWNAWWFDLGYFGDCVADRVINRGTEHQAELACVTSKFIDHYCGDLSNDLIILASCHSGQNDKLANAFLNKGAEAILGFTDTVYTGYCQNLSMFTLAYMAEIDEASERYRTLSEALELAEEDFGENDTEWYRTTFPDNTPKANTAEPILFGGTDAENYRLNDTLIGTLSGKICQASDRNTPVAGATITVFDAQGDEGGTLTANESGDYTVTLPVGDYRVTITAEGYLPFTAYATVTENSTTYMETFLMIEGEENMIGIATGTIKNALTGSGIEGVVLSVREGWNNTSGEIAATITTDSGGTYSLELPLGNYTLSAEKEGYISTSFNIIVQQDITDAQDGTMTPIVSGDDFRIVLTWGDHPRDLDSHVRGTLSNGNSFHVYFSQKSQNDGDIEVCNLDLDDTNGKGPETTTIHATSATPYYYYVYRYAGEGTVASSGAQVNVYQGENLIATFNVPTDQGSGDYWNIFAIVDGNLVIQNTITSGADISYAG